MSFLPSDLADPIQGTKPVIAWQEPGCPLCGARNWAPLAEAPDFVPGGTGLWFAVVQCQGCGICYTNPRPNQECMAQFYLPAGKCRPTRSEQEPAARRGRSGGEAISPAWRRAGQQGDYGFDDQAFSARLRGRALQLTGVDLKPGDKQLEHSEWESAAETHAPARWRAGCCHTVTMWHSLQYAPAPLEVLREARRLLGPRGTLIVAVPNIDSLPFRWFGSAWTGFNLPRHLTHFAPWTLHMMLERAGFLVGPIRMVRRSGWLRSSARLARRQSAAPQWQRWLERKPISSLASWYCYLTHQCDYIVVTAER